jgi:PadR family transcriptional regulator PadR
MFSMNTLVMVRVAILASLRPGKSFGNEILATVAKRTGGHIRLCAGSVYPCLAELEDEGLIRAAGQETQPGRGGRPRCYYELTAKGRKEASRHRAAMLGLLGAP